MQQHAWQTVRFGRIFRAAYAEKGRGGDVAVVFASHTAMPTRTDEAFKYLKAKGRLREVTYLAISGYYKLWGGDATYPGGDDKPGMTLDDYYAAFGRTLSA